MPIDVWDVLTETPYTLKNKNVLKATVAYASYCSPIALFFTNLLALNKGNEAAIEQWFNDIALHISVIMNLVNPLSTRSVCTY